MFEDIGLSKKTALPLLFYLNQSVSYVSNDSDYEYSILIFDSVSSSIVYEILEKTKSNSFIRRENYELNEEAISLIFPYFKDFVINFITEDEVVEKFNVSTFTIYHDYNIFDFEYSYWGNCLSIRAEGEFYSESYELCVNDEIKSILIENELKESFFNEALRLGWFISSMLGGKWDIEFVYKDK